MEPLQDGNGNVSNEFWRHNPKRRGEGFTLKVNTEGGLHICYGAAINSKYWIPLLASMRTVLFGPLTVMPLVTGDHVTGGVRLPVCIKTYSVAFVVQETTMFGMLAKICTLGEVMLATRLAGCASV